MESRTYSRYQAVKAIVSGKAKERWARRSSPNSALCCTSVNSSVEGRRAGDFAGGGVSVATESPRVTDVRLLTSQDGTTLQRVTDRLPGVIPVGAVGPSVHGHGAARGVVQVSLALSEISSGR
ncbi:hypothetical protein ACE1SV_14650 [Streptomyces sp. E-15]